jgi:hypothetical protein
VLSRGDSRIAPTREQAVFVYSGMDPLNLAGWGSRHGFKPLPTAVVGNRGFLAELISES